MNPFLLSVNTMMPVFLMIIIGWLLCKCNILPKHMLADLNNLCFKCFLPLLLFDNVRHTDFKEIFDGLLLSYALISILVMFCLLCWIVPKFVSDKTQQSVVIQGFYRSNYVILGLPIVINLYGSQNAATITMLIAVVVPLFNALAVILFQKFNAHYQHDWKALFIGIASNPLIIGSMLGFICNIGGIHFPAAINQTIQNISATALPISLLILGADLDYNTQNTNYKLLSITVLGRLVIIPLLFIPPAIALGFRHEALASLAVLYAAPSAVSGYIMAQQAEADSHLAGQVVVFTSLLSCLTLFIMIAVLKYFNLI